MTNLQRVFDRISTRLNDYLCEMTPGYDDSIAGFNEAWDVVRAVFKDEIDKGTATRLPGMDDLDLVIGELTAASLQISPNDDQIIADHVRHAVAHLLMVRHKLNSSFSTAKAKNSEHATMKTRFNMVEAMADEDQAFDQPCAFENRVGGHGTYCHNEKVDARKCPYRWTSIETHRKCEGFALNEAAYKGQWEEK